MFDGKRVGAVLLMAGEGCRFGSSVPKQFHLLHGKKIYRYALDTFLKVGLFDEVVLVCHRNWMVEGAIEGGRTRQESSFRGLTALGSVNVVLIHDGVRPFVSERILRDNVAGAVQWGAVDTCIRSADTLVHAPEGGVIQAIPKREEYLRGQTPQTFLKEWIVEAHEQAKADGVENASDDCQLVLRMGKPVHVVMGDEKNIKITSEFDLRIAEGMLYDERKSNAHKKCVEEAPADAKRKKGEEAREKTLEKSS